MKVPIAVGIIMGIMWGVVLYGFITEIGTLSFILCGNKYFYPIIGTFITFGVAMPVLLTYTYWVEWVKDRLCIMFGVDFD